MAPLQVSKRSTGREPVKLVRIHPVSPRAGYHALTYVLSGSPYPAFEVQRGWYEVDLSTARILARATNNHMDPDSKPIFQICDPEEAVAVEQEEAMRKARATAPIPLPRSTAMAPVRAPAARRPVAPVRAVAPPEPETDENVLTTEDVEEAQDLPEVREDREAKIAARERALDREARAASGQVIESATDEDLQELTDQALDAELDAPALGEVSADLTSSDVNANAAPPAPKPAVKAKPDKVATPAAKKKTTGAKAKV